MFFTLPYLGYDCYRLHVHTVACNVVTQPKHGKSSQDWTELTKWGTVSSRIWSK